THGSNQKSRRGKSGGVARFLRAMVGLPNRKASRSAMVRLTTFSHAVSMPLSLTSRDFTPAISLARGSMSYPTACLPKRRASTNVVPLPIMGSSTVSPRFEYRFMPYLASWGGHLAANGWSPCVAYRVSAASKFSFAIRLLATPFSPIDLKLPLPQHIYQTWVSAWGFANK